MNAVWPETTVEENNLYVHLSTLRRAFGHNRNLIITVPGRGYKLRHTPIAAVETACAPAAPPLPGLPFYRGKLTGRDPAIAEIRGLLRQTHALTLIGAGGIGKTSLAAETAPIVGGDEHAGVFCRTGYCNHAR